MYRIWVVEDEESLRKAEEKFINKKGYLVTGFPDGESMLEKLKTESPVVVFLDLRLPGICGEELLEKITETSPETRVIIVSAYSEVENVVSVVRKGAFDFIRKPFNIDEFGIKLEKALENFDLKEEIDYLKSRESSSFLTCPSYAMQKVDEMVRMVSSTPGNSTILINGESGSGKEVVAKKIHQSTQNRTGRFIELNCSSIPEPLLESELFGHVKGAFTDAHQEKKGLFELASQGTLFLDEIGDMPPKLQAKLLKVLESKEFKRVGGISPISVDLRIIAATNKDLEKEVSEGRFRADLFYRLNVFPILVPPLRERKEDIIPLADFFIRKFNTDFRKKVQSLSEELSRDLSSYSWPGNVRELKNVIERAMIMCQGTVLEKVFLKDKPSVSAEISISSQGVNLEEILSGIEKEYIKKALASSGWNQSQAAQMLGIPREILRYRMKKYDIS